MHRIVTLVLLAIFLPACTTAAPAPAADAAPSASTSSLDETDRSLQTDSSDETDKTDETIRVLFVITNHTAMGDTDKETGYFLSELSHPWHELVEAGYAVDFMSPEGGPVHADPRSMDLDDEINHDFWNDDEIQEALESTMAPSDVAPDDYRAIFFVGGHGTMWDFPGNIQLGTIAAHIWEAGGSVAAVCHGPAALIGLRLFDGTPLVEGKNLTAFTDDEERAVELADDMPFLLQTDLENRGATFHAASNFEENVIVDGQLITGQNPASAQKLGRELVKFLDAKRQADLN